MSDLDFRAHSAAAGLRHAVDQFEPITVTSAPARRYRGSRVVIALIALIVVSSVGAIIVAALRDDDTTVRTVDNSPVTATAKAFVGGHPIAITVDKRGAFVANERDEVVRLDSGTGKLAARVPMDFNVVNTVTDPTLGIWALGGAGPEPGGHVAFLAPSSRRPPFTVDLPEHPTGLALASGWVWVTSTSKLYRIDPMTGAVGAPFSIDARAAGLHALVFAGGLVWSADADRLLAFDPETESTTAIVATPEAWVTSVATDGRWLWTSGAPAGQPAVLERRDPRTGEVLQRYPEYPLAYYNGGESAVIAADGAVWAVTRKGQALIRTTRDGGIERVAPIPPRLRSKNHRQYRYFGVGAGALWYSVPEAGEVYRIPLP